RCDARTKRGRTDAGIDEAGCVRRLEPSPHLEDRRLIAINTERRGVDVGRDKTGNYPLRLTHGRIVDAGNVVNGFKRCSVAILDDKFVRDAGSEPDGVRRKPERIEDDG